jgi:DNA-binding phage protein
MPTSRSYHSYLIESLKDPQEAAAYLDAVLEDGTFEELSLAVRNVAEARIALLGDNRAVSEQQAIQQLLSEPINNLSTLLKIVNNLGFKISVTLKEQVA